MGESLVLFADHIIENEVFVRDFFKPPLRIVRVHEDVIEQINDLTRQAGKKKLRELSKFTCWPDHDACIEWSLTGIEGLPSEASGRVNFGFYFHGSANGSVVEGTGMCVFAPHNDKNMSFIPVRYDMESYTLVADDLKSLVRKRLEKYPPEMRKKLAGRLDYDAPAVDPIAFAAKYAPVLDELKPILFGILAFMNSPKLIRTREVDVARLNARRLKRGKYPYHPHHEVRLNIDKHAFKITQG